MIQGKYDQSSIPERRAEKMLGELSLEEKMAQISCIFPFGETYGDMEGISRSVPFGIGEVSTLEMRRIETLEEVAQWQRSVQKVVMENSPHHIPAIFHMEGLCGAFIQDTTSFPAGIGRGAGFDPELEERIGEIVGRQERACGITHILAPVLDISRDSRMGRQGETYGEDPTLAAALGTAYVKGIQKEKSAGRRADSVAKHFLAFHNSQGGIHGTHSDTPVRLLWEIYGKPFQAVIAKSGLKGIMPSYNSINGEPVSASGTLLQELLREEMGFDGVCISDYGAVGNTHTVQRIGESMGEAGYRCLEAGVDLETPSAAGYGEELKRRFESGEADMVLLDRAVLRVLTAKFRMGLFDHPFALEGEALREAVVDAGDRAVSLKSARESLVLLKNNGALPLRKGCRKIALIGPHADCARKFFGGYTHLCMMESTYAIANSIAGVSGVVQADAEKIRTVPGTHIQSDEAEEFNAILRRQKPGCRSLLQELRHRLPEAEIRYAYGYPIAGSDESGFAEALEAAAGADVVILTLGGKHGTCSMASMGEGVDASNINLPPCQEAFIERAAELGKPLVGVHFDGRPISSDGADRYLDAILEAWSPGETGAEAVSDALLGKYNPGGKLPVIAKGARGRKSRVTACTQLLAYSELTLSESRGWQYLSEGSPIQLFEGTRQDIALLSLASYFAELTETVAQENTESGEVLSLLLNALYALGNLDRPQAQIKAAFELKLMALIGFEPLADACACCGRAAPERPVLDVRNGVVRCKACGRGEGGLGMPLTAGALAALRWVLYGEERRLYSFTLEPDGLKKLGDAAEAYVHAMLERGFKTLDFYKSLQAAPGPPPGGAPL